MQRESLYNWCINNGAKGQQLIQEWTGIDEDNYKIDVKEITKGSGKRVYWKCTKGHGTWLAHINDRTSSSTGCPTCYKINKGKIVARGKLHKGENDLKTWCINNGLAGKKIMEEWTGINEAGERYNIDEIACRSNKKFWWKCSNNESHKWLAKVLHRTYCGSGCPYCCGQKRVQGVNDLRTFCENNNKQYIIEQLVGEDENGNKIDTNKLSPASHIKIKWIHYTESGELHEWIAAVSDRIYKNSGCPLCTGMNNLKPGVNDLKTWCKNNNEFGNIILRQWIGFNEYGENVKIDNISYGSKTKLAWMCDCGNIFYASPLHRTYSKMKCCKQCTYEQYSKRMTDTALQNSITLDEWCKYNGIQGAILQSQYTGISIDGNNVPINKITYGSDKKMLWEHKTSSGKLHQWYSTVSNRTHHNTNCPYCNNKGTSLPEQIIYRCFKQIYPDTISRGRFQGYEFDISIPELKTCIEYGSTYFHEGREQRDTEKFELCKRYNVNFIQIIDDGQDSIGEIWEQNMIVTKIDNNNRIDDVYSIAKYLFSIFNLDIAAIDYTKAVNESLLFMKE
jgi:hypothetical protein